MFTVNVAQAHANLSKPTRARVAQNSELPARGDGDAGAAVTVMPAPR